MRRRGWSVHHHRNWRSCGRSCGRYKERCLGYWPLCWDKWSGLTDDDGRWTASAWTTWTLLAKPTTTMVSRAACAPRFTCTVIILIPSWTLTWRGWRWPMSDNRPHSTRRKNWRIHARSSSFSSPWTCARTPRPGSRENDGAAPPRS